MAGLQLHHTRGGRGRALLLIHGLGSAGDLEWRFNLEDLARDHRVYAPDLPGFGRSDKPPLRYGVPYFTRVLEQYMDRLGVGSADVVGASLGGRIAIELALAHPSRVDRLVLVDTLGLGRPRLRLFYPLVMVPRLGEAVMDLVRAGTRRAPPPILRRAFSRRAGRAGSEAARLLDDRFLAALRQMHQEPGFRAAYLATLRSLARRGTALGGPALVDRLARWGKPVMLIWGAADPLFPVEQARSAHLAIPGSRLEVIEGAGHTPQAERPAEFNRRVREFVA